MSAARKLSNELPAQQGLKCSLGESAVGAGHQKSVVEVGDAVTVAAGREPPAGAGTGEQAGREPSPMPESVTLAESEWQRLKRCEAHLKWILRAVRLKNVHDRIEQARLWYGQAVLP